MTGLLNSLLGVVLMTGSLFTTADKAQDLLNSNTWIMLEVSSWCEAPRMFAGHNYKKFWINLFNYVKVGDILNWNGCKYKVESREVVYPQWYKLERGTGVAYAYTCSYSDTITRLVLKFKLIK